MTAAKAPKPRIKPLHAVTAALCAYETVAIVARNSRIPTITHMQTKFPLAGVALTATLAVHFFRADRNGGS